MRKRFSLKNILFSIVTCASVLFSFNGFAQQKKPKVALVLSGGGAKGIAHIPLLQTLDSLGIVPDLIVGNSMGSVVGGLYAMGYSGDSIAGIVKKANWDQLIGGRVSLKNVGVEEKTEFGRYLVDLDYTKGKVKVGKFLLNDQNLRQFIAMLTFPSYKIDDFSKLPIPFKAVATDIVNGKIVVLDQGSLATAMRASMSLPGVFSPVPYKNTLLVDGAILNNFPVDVAKDYGADIIIGSDVGDGMMKKDELENISSLLFQAGMLSSHLINPKNRNLCDILVNHTQYLTYGTSDFQKSSQIYAEGKLGVKDNLKDLVALSNRLKPYYQKKAKLPFVREDLELDTLIYNKINRTNLALVKARTNIQPGQIYSRDELMEGINRAMGTTIFTQITFEPFAEQGKLGLKLNGFERSKHQVKGALHYDNYHGVGILLNYTGRNIIGAASRSLVTVDIAEQPKFRLQHQKNFGSDRDWWWSTEVYMQRLSHQNTFNGEKGDEVKNRYFEFDNQVNRNITSMRSYIGFNLNYQNIQLEPKVKNNLYTLNSYSFEVIQMGMHYNSNTFNSTTFPTTGTLIKGNIGRSLTNDVKIDFTDINASNRQGSISNYTKFGFQYEKRTPLAAKISAIYGISGNYLIADNEGQDEISFADYGLGAKYTLGGYLQDPRKDSFIFPGLNEGELMITQFTKLNASLQYNFKPKLFIIPHVDFAAVGFNKLENYIENVFSTNADWQDQKDARYLFSSGATIGYDSILGPVTLDISWVNDVNKIKIFFGVGFQLHR